MEAGRYEIGGGSPIDGRRHETSTSWTGLHGQSLEDYLAAIGRSGEEPAPSEPQEEPEAEGDQPDVS